MNENAYWARSFHLYVLHPVNSKIDLVGFSALCEKRARLNKKATAENTALTQSDMPVRTVKGAAENAEAHHRLSICPKG